MRTTIDKNYNALNVEIVFYYLRIPKCFSILLRIISFCGNTKNYALHKYNYGYALIGAKH